MRNTKFTVLGLIADNERMKSSLLEFNLERDQIIAENERLDACLKWEQSRAERIGTHGPGCESWGPSHYECLLRELGQLKSECEALRRDAERLSWMERNMLSSDGQQIEAMDYRFYMPYLVNNAGGFGGGVGEIISRTLREAIDAAMNQEGRDG